MCRRTSMEYVTEAILNLRMAVKAHASLVGKSIPRPKLQKILKELDAEYDKTLKQKIREKELLGSCSMAAFLSIIIQNELREYNFCQPYRLLSSYFLSPRSHPRNSRQLPYMLAEQ